MSAIAASVSSTHNGQNNTTNNPTPSEIAIKHQFAPLQHRLRIPSPSFPYAFVLASSYAFCKVFVTTIKKGRLSASLKIICITSVPSFLTLNSSHILQLWIMAL